MNVEDLELIKILYYQEGGLVELKKLDKDTMAKLL